jgi:hypothetical protein
MRKKIIYLVVSMLLFTSIFGAMSAQKVSTTPEDNKPENTASTHTILAEFGTYTTCTYCKYAHEALIYLFRSGNYPFYYVTHVYDVNSHAYGRVKTELKLTSSPTVYWDGGWRKDIGSPNNASAIADYKKSIFRCENRTVNDIDLSVEATWLGAVNNDPEDTATNIPIGTYLNWTNSEFVVNVTATNNEASSYNGHLHVYVCDHKSSMKWYDTADRLYTMTFLDYAFNQNLALGADETWTDSTKWDGTNHTNGTAFFENITEENTWIVASLFDRDNENYVDETAGVRIGDGTDPKSYTVYFGNTTPPPPIIENISLMSYIPDDDLEFDTTYYWRIDVWDKKGKQIKGDILSFTTRDNDPPNIPSNPIPWNESINIPIDSNLTWDGGDPDGDPVRYDVYLGEVSQGDPKKVSSNQTNTSYTPFGLNFFTEYHWRIDAWDKFGYKREGELWNFKTEVNLPPYKPSDPHPENGEVGVPVNAILNWTGSDPNSGDHLTYDVWFDTSNPPRFKTASNVSRLYYDPPGDMELYETYYWRIVAWDLGDLKTKGDVWNFTTGLNTPPNAPIITGETSGEQNVEYDFTFSATDNENHKVKYFVKWGDGMQEETGLVDSGTEITLKHTHDKGEWTVTAWAEDEYGEVGDESTLEISRPKSKHSSMSVYHLLQSLLQRFPLLEKLLSLLPSIARILVL